MSRLAKSDVYAALDLAAQHILAARGDDHSVSRADIRRKLRELKGVEQRLTDIFYRFIDKRDYKPGARVTKSDVDETLAYAKEKLIDAYDKNDNGLSRAEITQMSTTAQLAVALARELKVRGDEQLLLEELRALGEGLLFLGRGSEADTDLRFFQQEAQLDRLTKESFASALGLDLDNREQAITIFEQGYEAYGQNWERYELYEMWDELSQIRRLDEFMQANLKDVTHLIVGEDGLRPTSEYPTYFVGLSPKGDIVGFETVVVWT